MKSKLFRIGLLLAIASFAVGCGPVKVSVYGASGKPYVAPDLCAAQLACRNAGESACYFVQSYAIDATGKVVETYKCEAAKK